MNTKAIVIIEDERDIREALGEILESEGYSVRSFANGLEALQALPLMPNADLILLDLMMPVMNGWEFLEARKRAQDSWARIPVVVVSAMKGLIPDSAIAGCITKPADIQELLSAVETHSGTVAKRSA